MALPKLVSQFPEAAATILKTVEQYAPSSQISRAFLHSLGRLLPSPGSLTEKNRPLGVLWSTTKPPEQPLSFSWAP
ncbi:protein of unknown function [Denitratisoma oestradiolicum]|uniref:Uncharacterized protein n=1 Tax=Denitratisoma oestradiolicum TaxID=311182 RepID=A0A6S6Y2W1_9PROT|nr:protein of unknown function [Denitratisoma oestradiolicum]